MTIGHKPLPEGTAETGTVCSDSKAGLAMHAKGYSQAVYEAVTVILLALAWT